MKKQRNILLLLLFTLFLSTNSIYADEVKQANVITGKVVRVTDGDTIHVAITPYKKEKIRLFGIDAPESTQQYGEQSRSSLAQMLGNGEVTVTYSNKDRYGRILGTVYSKKSKEIGKMFPNSEGSVNELMVRTGAAWSYDHYSTKYSALQKVAKKNKLGLWQNPYPEAPWDYRKRQRR